MGTNLKGQNGEDVKMVEKKFYLHFNELGSYEGIDMDFKTEEEAFREMIELKKDIKEYYTFIARKIYEKRVPPLTVGET